MGVKSTRTLTRQEAEDKYIALKAVIKAASKERKWRSQAAEMSNEELEDVLEIMNDDANGGEGFENYRIGG
jgi:hypothetical protein